MARKPVLIKRPGRVTMYLKKKYGAAAFNKDGTIKISYLKKAINEMKKRGINDRNIGLYRALVLALTMKTKWNK